MKRTVNPVIKSDILRYKKNKLGSLLAILSIVGNCLFFAFLYAEVKNDNYYYTWAIAFDVVFNLFFMLVVFLLSEQIKNYNRKLFPLQIILVGAQIGRIFWLPMTGFIDGAITVDKFIMFLVFLAFSAATLLASGIIGLFRTIEVEMFNKKVAEGKVSIEETLKQLDEEDEKQAAASELPAESNGEVAN